MILGKWAGLLGFLGNQIFLDEIMDLGYTKFCKRNIKIGVDLVHSFLVNFSSLGLFRFHFNKNQKSFRRKNLLEGRSRESQNFFVSSGESKNLGLASAFAKFFQTKI